MEMNQQNCRDLLAILNKARIEGSEAEIVADLKLKVNAIGQELVDRDKQVEIDAAVEGARLAAIASEAPPTDTK